MPREHKSRREVVNAIKSIPSLADLLATHDGHFDYELDLEVIVYGRNYGGKKVGPYVRLLTFDPGETIIKEGDWGGNTFYVAVKGNPDVFVDVQGRGNSKVAELAPGTQFGEMSVLAGVARNATVKAPAGGAVQVLEVERPALRLLRKLPKFGETLDRTYRTHGRNSILEELRATTGLPSNVAQSLAGIAQFKVFSRNHVLLREGSPVDRLFIIRSGWIHRAAGKDQPASHEREDFLGEGHCLGLEGVMHDLKWPYTVTLMGRTEILEISIGKLRQDLALRDAVLQALGRFRAPETIGERISAEPGIREKILETQQQLIDTGLVDGTNLLVMDMDLCVRCGNCSLACHKIHGQSRLLRRGIHVTRLEAPRAGSSVQQVLSPAVCLHCQDPECLTGCPTGAIGRMAGGHIDIDSKTCIGCGDCATQCPYNAISLVPRKKPVAAAANGLAAALRGLFALRPDPLPPAVEQTDELLAVKCNLCENTPLNPKGVSRRAYGCEEACPTGALARIKPREYFAEIGQIQGLAFLDQTHAVGRNIHRSDPTRKMLHITGIAITLLLTAVAVLGLMSYGLGGRITGFLNMRWITGLVGLGGIVGVMTYPVRRKIYTKRAGALRYWLLVHSYLGVLAGIMLLLHGGSDSGGTLTTVLMISFDLVILTGLFGILCYVIVPRLMTKIEGEPLLIDDLKTRRLELQSELAELSQSPSTGEVVRKKVLPRFISVGFLLRQYLKRESLDEAIRVAKEKFRTASGSVEDNRNLERAVEAAVTLRRVDSLIYLHRLLKAWLAPHVVFTSVMLALMVVHIIQVIYFA
jgi:Fe-S-cluster-containing dehydrogenase component/CRP-like cAMP-binding protein